MVTFFLSSKKTRRGFSDGSTFAPKKNFSYKIADTVRVNIIPVKKKKIQRLSFVETIVLLTGASIKCTSLDGNSVFLTPDLTFATHNNC